MVSNHLSHFISRAAAAATYDEEPTTFGIHYEHHGKSLVDRAELMERVGELLPSPDFKVDLAEQDHTIFIIVYHEVAWTFTHSVTHRLTLITTSNISHLA